MLTPPIALADLVPPAIAGAVITTAILCLAGPPIALLFYLILKPRKR